jgi:hypothetical protein
MIFLPHFSFDKKVLHVQLKEINNLLLLLLILLIVALSIVLRANKSDKEGIKKSITATDNLLLCG